MDRALTALDITATYAWYLALGALILGMAIVVLFLIFIFHGSPQGQIRAVDRGRPAHAVRRPAAPPTSRQSDRDGNPYSPPRSSRQPSRT